MKKLLAVLCAAMLMLCGVAAFAGCDNEITIPDEQGYTIKIGYTEYAPMNYRDENGDFVGYDTEFAIQLCKDLGYNYEFVLLNDWATKVVDLNAGTIDLVWNGMTITDDLKKNILISEPYMTNQQVIVGTAETLAKYDSVESLANATSIAYENGFRGGNAGNCNRRHRKRIYGSCAVAGKGADGGRGRHGRTRRHRFDDGALHDGRGNELCGYHL